MIRDSSLDTGIRQIELADWSAAHSRLGARKEACRLLSNVKRAPPLSQFEPRYHALISLGLLEFLVVPFLRLDMGDALRS